MAKIVDYYLSSMSPWAYLGHARFAAILQRAGAHVKVKPVDYGRIFSVSGGLPLKQRAPQRQAYRLVELRRWREFLGVPLVYEPKYFPYATEAASCLINAAQLEYGADHAMQLVHAILRACWAEERNCADPQTLTELAAAAGVDTTALRKREAEAKALYEANTQEAIDRQVFGAPTYAIDGELFWGQDRLDFVERALTRA